LNVGDDYVLELRNGTQQQAQADGRFSEIRFTSYNVSVESLAQQVAWIDELAETDSIGLVRRAMETGWTPDIVKRLLDRSTEGLRVLGMALLVLAMAGFPSGNRTRTKVPLEAVVMLLAFGERGISAYSPLGTGTGALMLIAIGGVILTIRL